jgi:hypothetical protein
MNLQLWIFILRVRLQYESSKTHFWSDGKPFLTYKATQAFHCLSRLPLIPIDHVKSIIEFLPGYNHFDRLLQQLTIFESDLRLIAKTSETGYQLFKFLNDFDLHVYPIIKQQLLLDFHQGKPWDSELTSSIEKMKQSGISDCVYVSLKIGCEYLTGTQQPISVPRSILPSTPKSTPASSKKKSSCPYTLAIQAFSAHARKLHNDENNSEQCTALWVAVVLLENTKNGWQKGIRTNPLPRALFRPPLKEMVEPHQRLLIKAAQGQRL